MADRHEVIVVVTYIAVAFLRDAISYVELVVSIVKWGEIELVGNRPLTTRLNGVLRIISDESHVLVITERVAPRGDSEDTYHPIVLPITRIAQSEGHLTLFTLVGSQG